MKRSERKARHAHAETLVQRLRDALVDEIADGPGFEWWYDLVDEADQYLGIPA